MKARYDTIFRDIRDSIEEGAYPYQAFLPSEAELTAAFACSHNTLRRALGLLRDQGYVQPVHGKGVRVIWREPERTTFTVGRHRVVPRGRRAHPPARRDRGRAARAGARHEPDRL